MTKPTKTQLEILEHYGVLGMKWGVRRDQAALDRAAGRSSKKSRRAASADSVEKSKRRNASKNRRNLSNNDIQEKINRLRKEKELKDLTKADLAPIRSRVERMATDAGFEVGKKITIAAMELIIRKYVAGENITTADLIPYLKPKKR